MTAGADLKGEVSTSTSVDCSPVSSDNEVQQKAAGTIRKSLGESILLTAPTAAVIDIMVVYTTWKLHVYRWMNGWITIRFGGT